MSVCVDSGNMHQGICKEQMFPDRLNVLSHHVQRFGVYHSKVFLCKRLCPLLFRIGLGTAVFLLCVF